MKPLCINYEDEKNAQNVLDRFAYQKEMPGNNPLLYTINQNGTSFVYDLTPQGLFCGKRIYVTRKRAENFRFIISPQIIFDQHKTG
jgi:hypothetical protein